MTKWIISENLRNPENPDWEKLSNSFFSGIVHPRRKEGFLLSRSSLRDCLTSFEIDCPILSLEVQNHCLIKEFPQFTISLSHTNQCGAALIAERKFFRSVGIDVEHEERIVNQSVLEKIRHPDDVNLRNIELWCLKEAAFKTIMNSGKIESPAEFSSICIKKDFWSHHPTNLSGRWEISQVKKYVVARSFLEN